MPQRKEDRTAAAPVPVRDKVAEFGINLNTVFTALMLAAIFGVWNTLDDIKRSLSELNATMAVVRSEYSSLRKDFDEHRHDPNAHLRSRK